MRYFTHIVESYKVDKLKVLSKITEEATEAEFNKEVEIDKKIASGKIRKKGIAKAAVQAVEVQKEDSNLGEALIGKVSKMSQYTHLDIENKDKPADDTGKPKYPDTRSFHDIAMAANRAHVKMVAAKMKKESVEENTEQLEESQSHIDTAYNWHGGSSSPLYSYASTGGKVHDENHREGLKKEIQGNIDWVNTKGKDYPEEYKGEDKKLGSLLNHVSKKKLVNEDTSHRVLASHEGVEVHAHDDPDDSNEGSYISIHKNGKQVADGDFDRGSDSFWVSHPSLGKGQKSFNTAHDVAKHFSSLKEDVLNELTPLTPQNLAKYKTAAGKSASDADASGDTATADKRFHGIVGATKREFDRSTAVTPNQPEYNDDDWYEHNPFTKEVNRVHGAKTPAAQGFRDATSFTKDRTVKMPNGNHAVSGMAAKNLGLKLKESLADDMLAVAKKIVPTARIVTQDQKKKEREELDAKRAAAPKTQVKSEPGAGSPAAWYDQSSGGKRNMGDSVEVTLKSFKEFSNLKEGRLAMPLKGHDYHTKPDDQLRYIIKDAGEAAQAMKNHSPASESKYLDQVNDASTILHYRKNGGKQLNKEEVEYVIHKNSRSPTRLSGRGGQNVHGVDIKDVYTDKAEADEHAKHLSKYNPVGYSVSPRPEYKTFNKEEVEHLDEWSASGIPMKRIDKWRDSLGFKLVGGSKHPKWQHETTGETVTGVGDHGKEARPEAVRSVRNMVKAHHSKYNLSYIEP